MEEQEASSEPDVCMGEGESSSTGTLPVDRAPKSEASEEGSASLERLGKGVRPLLEAINDLRRQGVEDLIPPLPKIVVVGDQSTGKSSLIEAISEIKVPRDVGTCTRCPLEINLAENDAEGAVWTCRVSLHNKFTYNPPNGSAFARGPFNGAAANTEPRCFGNFTGQTPEDFLFTTIYNKDEVQSAISRAQLAILNPHENYRKYQRDDLDVTMLSTREQFSPNVIRLDISGPNLPNLSFTDLPGVIQEADHDDHGHVVELVENLVKSYIKDEKALVLLARPMTEDANNSTAGRYVKTEGADHRCVGVLTKPDLIQGPRSWPKWAELLGGETFKKGHGYFVTRQPEQGLRDEPISHAQARAVEAEFFATEAPWNSAFATFRDRFGTIRLQNALSEKLTTQIVASLPEINEQVRQKAEAIDKELRQLPEPPADNLQLVLIVKFEELKRELQKTFEGGCGYNAFHREWHALSSAFRQAIKESGPQLLLPDAGESRKRNAPVTPQGKSAVATPSTPTPHRSSHRAGSAITIIDDDESTPATPERGLPSRKRHAGPPSPLQPKKPRMTRKISGVQGTSVLPSAPGRPLSPAGMRFTIRTIKEALRDGHTIGVPNQTDPKVVDRLSQSSIAHWAGPMDEFLDVTDTMLRNMASELLEQVLEEYKQTALFAEARAITERFLTELVGSERRGAQSLFKLEYDNPTTLNEDALESARKEALASLQAQRREWRVGKHLDEQEAKTGREMDGAKRQAEAAKVSDAVLGPDPRAKEIEVMAIVQGYYRTAMFRFIDQIRLSVLGGLFAKFREGVCPLLVSELGLMRADANEHCALLMAEDPERERRRAQLKKDKEMLGKAQQRLAGLV
ncbi:MAG: hypothetical protein M1832_000873 [Thelocarpon impressellum]|nr:MAG: hypothetical protein M1832_000873 [Thelocarpon impressellum]